MALFLNHRVKRGEFGSGRAQKPLMEASLRFVDRAMVISLFQLSKFSPVMILVTNGCTGLSEG